MNMNWFKKKQKAPIKTVKRSRLTIRYSDGKYIQFTATKEQGGSYIKPFIPFYKWFFGRESNYHMFKYTDGETLIVRSEIKSFEVQMVDVPIEE